MHDEGLSMLENKYVVMEEKMKMQSLENRVKRLEFEDERCRKMEASANIKAEKMIENRRRHYEDMLLKKNHSL